MKPKLFRATVVTFILLQLTTAVWSVSCPEYTEECDCTIEPDFIKNICSKDGETIALQSKSSNEFISSFEFECKNVEQRDIFGSLKFETIGVIPSESSEVKIDSCPPFVATLIVHSVLEQTNSSSLTLIVNNLRFLSHDIFSFRAQLTTLNLHGNAIEALPKIIFQSQINLKHLNINANKIMVLHPNIFDNISLLKLHLTYNKFIDVHLNMITMESQSHTGLELYNYKDKFGSNKICSKSSCISIINQLPNVLAWLFHPLPPCSSSTTESTSTTVMPPTTTIPPPKTTTELTSTTVAPTTKTTTTTSSPTSTTVLPPTTTTKPLPPPDHPSDHHTLKICFIVIGITIIICIVILLIVIHFRRRNRHPYEQLS